MAHRTLTELLEEANLVSKYPSAEQLRDRVTDYLRQVYRKIAAEQLYYPGVMVIEPTRYQSIELPQLWIKTIDIRVGDQVSGSEFVTRGINKFGQFVTGQPYRYAKEQGGKLWFTENNRLDVPLTLTYWQMPTDKLGNPLVDERMWMAACYYCWSHLSLIDLFSKNKQSYSAAPMQITKQMAADEMDSVRADCNELLPADFVDLYESLAMMDNSGPGYIRIAYGA